MTIPSKALTIIFFFYLFKLIEIYQADMVFNNEIFTGREL